MDGCARNLNLNKYYGCPGYLQFWWRYDKKWGYYRGHNIFFIYMSMGNIFSAQGQVTQKQIVRPGPKSNLYKILCLSVICKFEDPMKTEDAIVSTTFFPMLKGRYLQSLYGCPGYLQVWWWFEKHLLHYGKMKKVRWKLKALSCRQHFSGLKGRLMPKPMDGCSRNSNSSKILWLSWLPASYHDNMINQSF